jgi:hypothetical protein
MTATVTTKKVILTLEDGTTNSDILGVELLTIPAGPENPLGIFTAALNVNNNLICPTRIDGHQIRTVGDGVSPAFGINSGMDMTCEQGYWKTL